MRLVSFTLPHDPAPRTGVLAHDGARVVDLTEIGIASFAEGVARASALARLATHLLHVPGAVAHLPELVRLVAPVGRLMSVYDSSTGVPAVAFAGDSRSPAGLVPFGPDAAIPLGPGAEFGAGIAAVIGRSADALDAADVEASVCGLALLACWRSAPGRIDAAALGPWLVTLDEFTDPRPGALAVALDAAVAVNGRLLRGGSWASLTAKLAGAVVDASRRVPLLAGDAVAVATFELARDVDDNASTVADPDGRVARQLAPGDQIVLQATKLGVLRAFAAPERREAGIAPAH